jgi:hypothetical protein
MMTELSLFELRAPPLQFGGAASTSDPKSGLDSAGPFDLRFGAARKDAINVGVIGPMDVVDSAQKWLTRCAAGIPSFGPGTALRRPFPGFSEVFRKKLVYSAHLTVTLDDAGSDSIEHVLAGADAFVRFQTIVDIYDAALQRLAGRDVNRPDVVLICLPQSVLDKCRTVERQNTEAERERAKAIRKARASRQTDFFDLLDEVEESEDDFLSAICDTRSRPKLWRPGCRSRSSPPGCSRMVPRARILPPARGISQLAYITKPAVFRGG